MGDDANGQDAHGQTLSPMKKKGSYLLMWMDLLNYNLRQETNRLPPGGSQWTTALKNEQLSEFEEFASLGLRTHKRL